MINKSKNKSKVNTPLISVIAILAIVLIVWIAIDTNNAFIRSSSSEGNKYNQLSGQVTAVINEDIQDTALCKLIISQNEAYDNTEIITGLQTGLSTYYSGQNIEITTINSDGCTININGNSDYIVIGQIQKIGQLYVTVTGISK